jgi:hypothetical protein
MPNVEPLREILLSKTVLSDMSREDAIRWEEALSVDGPRAVDETTVRVDDLVERIKMGGRPGSGQTEALLTDLRWWLRFVLESHTALLQKVIGRGPVDIVGFIRQFFSGPDDTIDDHHLLSEHRDAFLVFCTDRLIDHVFAHIRVNATVSHRIAGANQRFLVDFHQPARDKMAVTVRNSGSTRDSTGGGKGLETLEHRLARFGGSIRETETALPWTFAITVELDRWRMAT